MARQETATLEQLVTAIKEQATTNRDVPGWDSIARGWSDEEIAAEIKGARTIGGAIRKLTPAIAVLAGGRGADIATDAQAAPPTPEAAQAPEVAVAAAETPAGETRECVACTTVKAITAFPTTGRNKDGVMGRGKKCRACRDAK
jgi:hypothetical protein